MNMYRDYRQAVRRGASNRPAEESVFDDLLHPGRAFARPSDVVNDPDLTLNEKRAILASWASDARAAEPNPLLRRSDAGMTASWDEIMAALRELDLKAAKSPAARIAPESFWWPRGGLESGCRPA
jgi:hypothetical protein